MSSPDPLSPCERSAKLREHESLVRRIAGRLRARVPASVDMDELVQAGMIGLNDAMSRFQDNRGATFHTYASRRIEGAMLDALRATDTLSRDTRAFLTSAGCGTLEKPFAKADLIARVAELLES